MKYLGLILIFNISFLIPSCAQEKKSISDSNYKFEIVKSEAEWKDQLTSEEFEVLRNEGTERAFSGKYVNWKDKGVFTCKACDNPLFSSEKKFKSGTGWPSFYDILNENSIVDKKDNQFGWNRVEIECQRCGSHLGHVFEDGPKPTGLRYCINSISLNFIKK
jgi:peptide-methionine (R)-S-oxide reductase